MGFTTHVTEMSHNSPKKKLHQRFTIKTLKCQTISKSLQQSLKEKEKKERRKKKDSKIKSIHHLKFLESADYNSIQAKNKTQ